jgi:predicted transcriptional regulator
MRKTDDHVILQMLNEGKKQIEIAEHFGVSPPAICKRIKRLANQLPESFENLTKKKQNFVLAIAEGKTQTQAALDSHECGSLDSAKNVGSQLMKQPDIQIAVSELMQEAGLTKRYRIQKLKSCIDHPDPNVILKSLDQSWKLDGAYIDNQIHIHASYDDLKREQAENHDRIAHSDREFKKYYMAEITKLHPEMDKEAVSKMAEKTLNALFPERENVDFLETDTVEGEIIAGD